MERRERVENVEGAQLLTETSLLWELWLSSLVTKSEFDKDEATSPFNAC